MVSVSPATKLVADPKIIALAEELLTEAKAYLVVNVPYYAHILYDKMIIVWNPNIPTMGTDDVRIHINPQFLCDLPIKQRVFAICHETEHAVRGHMARGKKFKDIGDVDGEPYNHNRMNIAMDWVINDHLIVAKVGEFNPAWLHEPKKATWMDLPEDVYKKTPKDPEDGGFDEHMDPDPNAPPSDDISWKQTIAAAANAAKAMGKMPGNIQAQVDEFLSPQIDWKEFVRASVLKTAGRDTRSYRKPNRRRLAIEPMVWMPGYVGHACGPLVILDDTSSSVSMDEQQVFFGAMSEILADLTPTKITLMFVSTKVDKVVEMTNAADLDEVMKDFPKGGGTAFEPGFDYVREHGVECETLLYLTDMECNFPDESIANYPVLWVATTDIVAPWGVTVKADLKPSHQLLR